MPGSLFPFQFTAPLRVAAATETGSAHFMNRALRVLLILLCFEMGALLLYLPWSVYWDQNYFLSHFPSLIPILLHPSFRGAVSGMGVLDIILAINLITHRRPLPAATQ